MEVNVCVPVLKRYDLLKKLFMSLQSSSIAPNSIVVIDNGHCFDDDGPSGPFKEALMEAPCRVEVHYELKPMGIAESWNWFIRNVPEERIITNDDVEFGRDSLWKITCTEGDLVWAGEGFSCFLIRDSCVQKLGYFDENISPGYAYYEDVDYLQRLDGCGTRVPSAVAASVEAGIEHARSSTLAACTPEEMAEHHRKFRIAQRNYMAKWGLTTI